LEFVAEFVVLVDKMAVVAVHILEAAVVVAAVVVVVVAVVVVVVAEMMVVARDRHLGQRPKISCHY
jgi:hypothetical protein